MILVMGSSKTDHVVNVPGRILTFLDTKKHLVNFVKKNTKELKQLDLALCMGFPKLTGL